MKKMSFILTLIFITALLCSCAEKENISHTDISDTSGVTQSAAIQTLKPAESTPELSNADESILYGYIPMGYIDDEMNYLLLYKTYGVDCEIVVYNEKENCFSKSVMEYGVVFPIVNYGDGIFTTLHYCFPGQDNYSIEENKGYDHYVCVISYDKDCNEIKRIEIPYYPDDDNGVNHILCATYHKESDRYLVCYQNNQSKEYIISWLDKNGKETEQLLKGKEYRTYEIYTEDNRIILWRRETDGGKFDVLQVLDLKGNTLHERRIGNGYNAIRTERAGRYIYMLPSQRTDFRNKPLPTGEVAVYDTERDELFLLRPKTVKEAALIRFTPNGRYAVAVNVEDITNENQTEYLGSINTVRIYDIATGEVIKEFTEEKPFWFTTLVVYNDGFIVRDVNTVRYEYKFDFE